MPKADPIMRNREPIPDPLVELAATTLRGDTRDALLGWFKAQPKAWPFLSEREQRDLAEAADRFAETLVVKACQIIAAGERPCIEAALLEFKVKAGVEAKVKFAANIDVIEQLTEAVGRPILVVCSGAEQFEGEQRTAQSHAEPEQRDLGIGDEYRGDQ